MRNFAKIFRMSKQGKAKKDGRKEGKREGKGLKKNFGGSKATTAAPKNVVPKPKKDSDTLRLNKFIANSGACSRRDADIYIASGNVTVNGKVVQELGAKVKFTDAVKFDGKLLTPQKKEFILLNKPKGFSTNFKGESGQRTVMDLVANASRSRLDPVGRLDRNTTGLLLFTNDGEVTKKLTNIKKGARQIYHVELSKNFKYEDLRKIQDGLKVEGHPVPVDEITYIENAPKREVGIQIHTGKNRIVRTLFEQLGYDVVKLDRVIFGGLTKKDLPRGHWRYLSEQEIINLKIS